MQLKTFIWQFATGFLRTAFWQWLKWDYAICINSASFINRLHCYWSFFTVKICCFVCSRFEQSIIDVTWIWTRGLWVIRQPLDHHHGLGYSRWYFRVPQTCRKRPKSTKISKIGRKFFHFSPKTGKMLFREITELEKQNKNETVPKIWDNRKKKIYFQSILSFFLFINCFFKKGGKFKKTMGAKKENKIFLNQSDSVSKIFAKFFKKFWREFFLRKMLEHSRLRVSWHNIELLEYLFPWLSWRLFGFKNVFYVDSCLF